MLSRLIASHDVTDALGFDPLSTLTGEDASLALVTTPAAGTQTLATAIGAALSAAGAANTKASAAASEADLQALSGRVDTNASGVTSAETAASDAHALAQSAKDEADAASAAAAAASVTVTDGTNSVTATKTLNFAGATVSGSGGSATVTIASSGGGGGGGVADSLPAHAAMTQVGGDSSAKYSSIDSGMRWIKAEPVSANVNAAMVIPITQAHGYDLYLRVARSHLYVATNGNAQSGLVLLDSASGKAVTMAYGSQLVQQINWGDFVNGAVATTPYGQSYEPGHAWTDMRVTDDLTSQTRTYWQSTDGLLPLDNPAKLWTRLYVVQSNVTYIVPDRFGIFLNSYDHYGYQNGNGGELGVACMGMKIVYH